MLCVLIHNVYLVIVTDKRTGQYFIDQSVTLTAINIYLLVKKVLYIGRTTQIFYMAISPTSAPQIRRYQQKTANGS